MSNEPLFSKNEKMFLKIYFLILFPAVVVPFVQINASTETLTSNNYCLDLGLDAGRLDYTFVGTYTAMNAEKASAQLADFLNIDAIILKPGVPSNVGSVANLERKSGGSFTTSGGIGFGVDTSHSAGRVKEGVKLSLDFSGSNGDSYEKKSVTQNSLSISNTDSHTGIYVGHTLTKYGLTAQLLFQSSGKYEKWQCSYQQNGVWYYTSRYRLTEFVPGTQQLTPILDMSNEPQYLHYGPWYLDSSPSSATGHAVFHTYAQNEATEIISGHRETTNADPSTDQYPQYNVPMNAPGTKSLTKTNAQTYFSDWSVNFKWDLIWKVDLDFWVISTEASINVNGYVKFSGTSYFGSTTAISSTFTFNPDGNNWLVDLHANYYGGFYATGHIDTPPTPPPVYCKLVC